MPKFNPKDTDWARIEHMQSNPESGKGKNARGGNNRIRNLSRFDEHFDSIMTTCSDCGEQRKYGEKCENCGGR